MYNKKRRVFEIITSCCLLEPIVFALLLSVINLICLNDNLTVIILSIVGILITGANVFFGVCFIKKPKQIDGKWQSKKTIHICLIVCSAVLFVYFLIVYFVLIRTWFVSVAGLFGLICAYLGACGLSEVIPLEIITSCLKMEQPIVKKEGQEIEEKRFTLKERVEQLKELKESGVITEEECKTAVLKLVDKIVE